MKKKLAILIAIVLVVGLLVPTFTKKAYAKQAQMYMELPENVKKEQEIKVKVKLDSDVNLYSVDSYIAYDAEKLEFIPENDLITGTEGVLEIKEAFAEETTVAEYEITFKTLEVGEAFINFTDVYLIDYQDLDYIQVPPTSYSMNIDINNEVAEDARLSDLIVAPGDLSTEFNPNILNYEMYVGMDVDYVGISAFALNEDSIVEVDMPDKLVEGENILSVKVTALSGNVNVYTIKIFKGDYEMTTEQEDSTEDVTTQTEDILPEENTDGLGEYEEPAIPVSTEVTTDNTEPVVEEEVNQDNEQTTENVVDESAQ